MLLNELKRIFELDEPVLGNALQALGVNLSSHPGSSKQPREGLDAKMDGILKDVIFQPELTSAPSDNHLNSLFGGKERAMNQLRLLSEYVSYFPTQYIADLRSNKNLALVLKTQGVENPGEWLMTWSRPSKLSELSTELKAARDNKHTRYEEGSLNQVCQAMRSGAAAQSFVEKMVQSSASLIDEAVSAITAARTGKDTTALALTNKELSKLGTPSADEKVAAAQKAINIALTTTKMNLGFFTVAKKNQETLLKYYTDQEAEEE